MPTVAETAPTCIVRGLSFDALAQALARGRTSIFTLNLMHLRLLAQNPEFRESYREASIVTLDSNWLNTCFLRRRMTVAAGSDFVHFLGSRGALRDKSVLVVGNVTPADAARVMASRRLDVVRPPFGFIRDPAAVEDVIARCRALEPEVIFIAVGAPQSEMLALRMRRAGLAEASILCCGAAFEFELGVQRRSPVFLRRTGLEWVWRLATNPRRLAGRYASDAGFVLARLGQFAGLARSGRLRVGGLHLQFRQEAGLEEASVG
ncbi:N-acetylglucosaminyldiphosphoundecaprenol N-acetyl-beta-D-mannosaminyltransferase [Methylobacterium crusticola]|uniref:N-acetylglucosaminyldiphosphoundecaprenol N-acetyl-beta-D-mannosaminyltransferase n=1 Tax=Methylobacterium crusticola TaxID=1697972 RepID=A0ABQ4R0K4_9HYPH|nr:WecB/TagA/CpsF family glycosyltransferase [Methylobacterium crusticola]GJD50831.1 N-acetylglucosaminyldiphosphoundecaprenol N-acetyl-beta-D-mannosaminyltransferase [Methylobacterium crusticola]